MFENKKRAEALKEKEKETEELNKKLRELKWQYEVMLETLKSKNKQADDLIKQLSSIMAHIKKKYAEEGMDDGK